MLFDSVYILKEGETNMKKLLIFSFIICCLFLTSCRDNTDGPTGGDTPTVDEGPKELELRELEIVSNGNDVIYLGETFTAKGYDVNLVYRIVGSQGETEKFPCENYVIDDSNVNYEKIGTYSVVFTARVKSRVLKKAVNIRIADSRLIELGINHLYGIKAEEYTGANIKIGQKDLSSINTVIYLIYTNGTYENDELVVTEERKRSGYELDTSFVDVTKAGQYPVYVTYQESYDVNGEKIDVVVKTFFLVTVE